MGADNKKEWFAKSQVDYFSSFITLWLSCNSWYNFHYSLSNDREHINKIKSDFSKTNKLYSEFKKIFGGANSKEQKSLFSNLELLHYSLNRKLITPQQLISPLTFEYFLYDYNLKSNSDAYNNIIIQNAKSTTGKIKENVEGVDLGDIVVKKQPEKVFAGLFEIIYQVRCCLVHGELEPSDDSHEVVKYCYSILFQLMKSFCT